MADERDKKPLQFSLGRAMGAMTIICIALAVAVGCFSADIAPLGTAAVLMGFGSTIGVILGGRWGAAIGAVAGVFPCFVVLIFLWLKWASA